MTLQIKLQSGVGIEKVSFEGCSEITDDSVPEVASWILPDVRSLSLSQLILTDGGLNTLLQSCTLLYHLRIADCNNLSSNCIPIIGSYCLKLKSIGFIYDKDEYTAKFDSSILTLFVQNCNIALKSISVVGFQEVSDIGVSYISECYYNSLQKVNFSKCRKLTDKSLIILSSTCRYIQEIIFNGNGLITDEGFNSLSLKCPRLQRIDFGNCPLISEAAVLELASRCQHLKEVSFENCENLGDLSFTLFLRKCANLQVLNYSGTSIRTLPTLVLLPRKLSELNVTNCKLSSPLSEIVSKPNCIDDVYEYYKDNQLSCRYIVSNITT